MLKIDKEKFDEMLEKELLENVKYKIIKNIIKNLSQDEREEIASFLFQHSERIFNKGVIQGMKFVLGNMS